MRETPIGRNGSRELTVNYWPKVAGQHRAFPVLPKVRFRVAVKANNGSISAVQLPVGGGQWACLSRSCPSAKLVVRHGRSRSTRRPRGADDRCLGTALQGMRIRAARWSLSRAGAATRQGTLLRRWRCSGFRQRHCPGCRGSARRRRPGAGSSRPVRRRAPGPCARAIRP